VIGLEGTSLYYMGEASGYYVKISVAPKIGLVYAAVANSSGPSGKKSTQDGFDGACEIRQGSWEIEGVSSALL